MKYLSTLIATAMVLTIADSHAADQFSSCNREPGYAQVQSTYYGEQPVVFPQVVQQPPVVMQWFYTPVASPFETQQTCNRQADLVFADAGLGFQLPRSGELATAPLQTVGSVMPAAYNAGLQETHFSISQSTDLRPTDEPPVLPGVDTE